MRSSMGSKSAPALSLLILLASSGAAFAQASPPQPASPAQNAPAQPAKPVDPRLAAAQAAFEALPEATRITSQNDLVWTTNFSGAALGSFGRLTFDAICALQKDTAQKIDGILNEPQRKALADAAARQRTQAGFVVRTDPATGSGIGIPAQLLTTYEKAPTGGKWSSAKGDVVLETVRTAPDKTDMAATFDRFVTAQVPGRKVTYKLLRPDFFVVTGEMGPKKFYTRFAPTPEGLRGYTLTYDVAAAPGFDRIVIAIANTFEPLKKAGGSAPAATQPASTQSASGVAVPSAVPTPAVERIATGLLLPNGRLLTSAKGVNGCKSLSVGGKPASVAVTDPASGLAMLTVAGLSAPATLALRTETIQPSESLVAFGFDGARPQRLGVAPASVRVTTGGGLSIAAALQAGAAGSVVVDRQGRIAGPRPRSAATRQTDRRNRAACQLRGGDEFGDEGFSDDPTASRQSMVPRPARMKLRANSADERANSSSQRRAASDRQVSIPSHRFLDAVHPGKIFEHAAELLMVRQVGRVSQLRKIGSSLYGTPGQTENPSRKSALWDLSVGDQRKIGVTNVSPDGIECTIDVVFSRLL